MVIIPILGLGLLLGVDVVGVKVDGTKVGLMLIVKKEVMEVVVRKEKKEKKRVNHTWVRK